MVIKFFEFCLTASLVQFVNEPTRENYILKLCLVNGKQLVEHVSLTPPFLNSNHNIVEIALCCAFKRENVLYRKC